MVGGGPSGARASRARTQGRETGPRHRRRMVVRWTPPSLTAPPTSGGKRGRPSASVTYLPLGPLVRRLSEGGGGPDGSWGPGPPFPGPPVPRGGSRIPWRVVAGPGLPVSGSELLLVGPGRLSSALAPGQPAARWFPSWPTWGGGRYAVTGSSVCEPGGGVRWPCGELLWTQGFQCRGPGPARPVPGTADGW